MLFAHLLRAAVLSGALLTSASPRMGSREIDSLEPQQARELHRIHDLMTALARAVLESPDEEELDASIESQMFSGLFADLIAASLDLATRSADVGDPSVFSGDLPPEFIGSLERLGIDSGKLSRALELSALSRRLAQAILSAEIETDTEGWVEGISAGDMDLAEFLYDVDAPLEFREAAYAEWKSTICFIAVAYAAAHDVSLPVWMMDALISRWLHGQIESLPVVYALAIERNIEIFDPYMDKFILDEGVDPPDLERVREKGKAMAESLRIIAEHASRQPDGVWPRRI